MPTQGRILYILKSGTMLVDAGNDDFDFPGNNYLLKVPAESQLMAGGLELSQQDAARSVSSPKATNAG